MEIGLSGIENIIFDLGNVLVNIRFKDTIDAFIEIGMDENLIVDQLTYNDPLFYKFETGLITAEEFIQSVHSLIGNSTVDLSRIVNAWNAMIGDFPLNRLNMLKELSAKYKLYLFSNTNSLHIENLEFSFSEKYGLQLSSLFDKVFYSHEINERKPDISSFRKVINLAKINPTNTLFIDDLQKNIEGARLAGLNAYWLQPGMEISDLLK